MINQEFDVIPEGLIQSGHASFQIDEKTGKLKADGSIKAGIGFFKKSFDDHEEFKIDPAFIESSYLKVGRALTFGPVNLEVKALSVQMAEVSVSIKNQYADLTGLAQVNVKGRYLHVESLTLKGKVRDFGVTIKLKAVL